MVLNKEEKHCVCVCGRIEKKTAKDHRRDSRATKILLA
jgi:hypothetical protein